MPIFKKGIAKAMFSTPSLKKVGLDMIFVVL